MNSIVLAHRFAHRIVIKPTAFTSTISAVYFVFLLIHKISIRMHALSTILITFMGFGYGGASTLLRNYPKTRLYPQYKIPAISFFITLCWFTMIVASPALCSVYPLLYYNKDDQGNSAVAAFIGGLFGVAKSIVVKFFMFIAAPLCAAVIGFVRENNGEIINKEEILGWSQLTDLRFTKGILTGVCIILIIIMYDILSFLVATTTSLVVGKILAEIGLWWWNVKHGVKKLVVEEIGNKRMSRRSTAALVPAPQDSEMEVGAVEEVEMEEDGDEDIGLMEI